MFDAAFVRRQPPSRYGQRTDACLPHGGNAARAILSPGLGGRDGRMGWTQESVALPVLDRCGSEATFNAFACWSGGRTDAVSVLTSESSLARIGIETLGAVGR